MSSASSLYPFPSKNMSKVSRHATIQSAMLLVGCVIMFNSMLVLVDSLSTTTKISPAATTPEQRAAIAKQTWKTIGSTKTPDYHSEIISLDDETRITVYNPVLFNEFTKIKGTYFMNGLSSCKIGNRIIHPFEAHGYVKSIAFDGTGNDIVTKATTIETPLTKWERRLNVPLARGVMSSLGSAVLNAFTSTERNTANLSATLWPPVNSNSKQNPILIVAGDNAMPYVIDPTTMKTIGPISSFLPGIDGNKKFLAHTRIDDKRQHLILCKSKFDVQNPSLPGSTFIEFLEYDVNFELVAKRSFQSDRFMVFHDWMISENFYIVPKNPAKFQWNALPRFIAGLAVGTEIFDMDYDSVGQFILIPRHNPSADVIECESDSFFNIFHFGPCYEHSSTISSSDNSQHENDLLTIYGSVFDRYKFGGEMGYSGSNEEMDPIRWSSSADVPAPRLDKFVIDLKSSVMIERQRVAMIDESSSDENNLIDIPVDMPTFNGDGEKCRYGYFLGAARPEGWFPFRSVLKKDLHTQQTWNWDAGDERIVSEAMFIPREGSNAATELNEDDGFVVSIAHNAEEKISELVVWDSLTFGNGPVGIIKLGDLVPWCVHGSWVPGFVAKPVTEQL